MNINMVKRILSFSLVSLTCLSLIGCGNNTNNRPNNVIEFGDIENAPTPSPSGDDEDDNNTSVSLPYYDVTNLIQARAYTSSDKVVERTSYYKEQLSSRQRRAYDAIYNTAESRYSTLELESSQMLKPEELETVMNVIFLDTPELFYLNNEYSYQTNSEGYIYRIYLFYNMSNEEIEKIEYDLARKKPEMLTYRKSNDYDTISRVILQLRDGDYASLSIDEYGSFNDNCTVPFISSKKNSIGLSKTIMYWLRNLGIDCSIVLGEPVSDSLSDNYELVANYIRFKDQTFDGTTYHVRMNYSYYWAWNVVKIDDTWYNLDVTYSNLLNTKYRYIEKDSLYFVSDQTLSQTRLFYMNEDILGLSPSCTEVGFQATYRKGNYILTHTEEQMILRLRQELALIDQSNSTSKIWQFADEETFNYFIDNFKEQFESYNNTYSNPFGDVYKLESNRDSLYVSLSGIINNF